MERETHPTPIDTTAPDTLPLLNVQDRLARISHTVAAIALAAETLGRFEGGAISELAETALRRLEKAERRLNAYRTRLGGGAATHGPEEDAAAAITALLAEFRRLDADYSAADERYLAWLQQNSGVDMNTTPGDFAPAELLTAAKAIDALRAKPECIELKRQREAIGEQRKAVEEKILATRATTIRGALAKLEIIPIEDGLGREEAESLVADLRAIAVGGASWPRPTCSPSAACRRTPKSCRCSASGARRGLG